MEEKLSLKNIFTVAAVAIIITGCYLFMITRTTLWDRDEPRFARASVEMIESGNYLFPTFNDEVWADKPVLVYWLMTVSIKVFGSNEFACRFWSAIGTGICSVLTFMIGRKLFGFKTGLLAMGILATSTLVLVQGTMATADGATLPFTLGAMTIFTYAITSKVKQSHIIAIGVLMGLGALAKGPIGFMPMPVMFLTFWFTMDKLSDFAKNSLLVCEAVAIACGVFLIWALQANAATDGEFLNTFIGRHVLTRAAKPMENHGGSEWWWYLFYLPIIIGGFFPWTLFLPAGFSALTGNRLTDSKPKKMLLVWIITIVVVMSLAATKLPHYIYFVWPGLALISAAVITAFTESRLSLTDKIWLWAGAALFALLGLLVGAGLLFPDQIQRELEVKIEGLKIPAIACGVIMLSMTAMAIFFVAKKRFKASYITIVAGMIAFHIPHLMGLMPAVEKHKMPPNIAKVINEETGKDVQTASYKFGEPSLNYYVGRHIERLENAEQVKEWLAKPEQVVLVSLRSELDKVTEQLGGLTMTELGTAKGQDYSKGTNIIELVAVTNR